RVVIDGETTAAIDRGLLVLVGIEKQDSEAAAERLLERLLGYRVFPDEHGRMNRSVCDESGALLLVPQFTLAADTRKGTRASFTSAAPPEEGHRLFEHLCALARAAWPNSCFGQFGADMKVHLVNDGPVTFWIAS
ncbi:MAG: D-tyrosyl-tRNA(Tyr) deacylase, partial [Proteobacteria bacterium]|nr:D-tyrosyl-tRNA(Tyr) deacylase [Pseudomonadota bacterium]